MALQAMLAPLPYGTGMQLMVGMRLRMKDGKDRVVVHRLLAPTLSPDRWMRTP